MMSSTTSTSIPVTSVLRSLRILTTPEDLLPQPYEETAIQSIRLNGECPGEFGHDHIRSIQHADEEQVFARIVAIDLGRELGDPAGEFLFGTRTCVKSPSSWVASTGLSLPQDQWSRGPSSRVAPGNSADREPSGVTRHSSPGHFNGLLAMPVDHQCLHGADVAQ